MKRFFVFLLVIVSAAALSGQAKKKDAKPAAPSKTGTSSKPSALDKATLDAYIRHLEAWDQSINVDISDPKPSPMSEFDEVDVHASKDKAYQDFVFYVSKDGKLILQGNVYQTAENPFKTDLDKLKGVTDHAPSYGTQGAPVVIVEFSDFECPYCREEAKTLRSNLLTTFPKDIHLYHLDFPLENAHPWARAAAIAARCVYKINANAFWDYYDWIYDHQADINTENLKAKVLEWAKTKENIDSLQLSRCMDNKETDAEVAKSIEDGKKLQVNQTPMFFVNGRRLAGAIDWANMKHIIEQEAGYQKTAKNAGEDCGCSATLPSASPAPTTPLGGLK